MDSSSSLAQRLGDIVQPSSQANSQRDSQANSQANSQASDGAELLRLIAIGSPTVVTQHIRQMYLLGYAQPHEWSRELPTANPSQIMRVMTKRVVATGN